MKQHRIIIWTKSVSDFVNDNVYGIGVQLYFWAQTFADNGWQATSYTSQKTYSKDGICFKHISHWGKLEIVHEWLIILLELLITRPTLIISRGADRGVYPLAIISRCLGVKYVFFSASDVNFEPGKELIAGGKHNRRLWQQAVRKLRYIVVQNRHQQTTLKHNYDKESLLLCNLWGKVKSFQTTGLPTDVVWVANFRRLKRAEWMVNAAKAMPEYDFTLIGGPSEKEKEYYTQIEEEAKTIPNLHFLGKKSFFEANSIIAKSKILCCTSTFEGFPNTFLQAWANKKPIISTVNPSDVISTYNLGNVVDTEESFQQSIRALLSDSGIYSAKQRAVLDYFERNHSPEISYNKLMDYIDVSQG